MQLKILVIEDEDEIREIICEILLAEHYAVIEAKNGAVGIQLARLHLPDLIICDILMPEIDGYEVLIECAKISPPNRFLLFFLLLKPKNLLSAKVWN
jgi:CheY-like chemotaxis protein